MEKGIQNLQLFFLSELTRGDPRFKVKKFELMTQKPLSTLQIRHHLSALADEDYLYLLTSRLIEHEIIQTKKQYKPINEKRIIYQAVIEFLESPSNWYPSTHKLFPEATKHTCPHIQSFFGTGNESHLLGTKHAVLGSRKVGSPAKKITRRLCEALVRNHIVIVSGGAIGIDIVAHFSSKNSGQYQTILVLPGGLRAPAPTCHQKFYAQFIRNGGFIACLSWQARPVMRFDYLIRNKFLASMCEKVFIVQANEESGAYKSGLMAADLGIDLMVWGGELSDVRSFGSRQLIAHGSTIFKSVKDIGHLITF